MAAAEQIVHLILDHRKLWAPVPLEARLLMTLNNAPCTLSFHIVGSSPTGSKIVSDPKQCSLHTELSHQSLWAPVRLEARLFTILNNAPCSLQTELSHQSLWAPVRLEARLFTILNNAPCSLHTELSHQSLWAPVRLEARLFTILNNAPCSLHTELSHQSLWAPVPLEARLLATLNNAPYTLSFHIVGSSPAGSKIVCDL